MWQSLIFYYIFLVIFQFMRYVFFLIIYFIFCFHSNAQAKNEDIKTLESYYKDNQNDNRKKIKEIIKKNENNLEFNFKLGKLLMKMGNLLDAQIIFKKLYDSTPKDKYEIAFGEALLEQKKFQDVLYIITLNGLTDAIKSKKYFLHAHAHLGLSNGKEALNRINVAIKLQENTNYLLLKARILTAINHIEDSIKLIYLLENGYKIKESELYILKAENFIATKDYIKAKHLFNQVIHKDSKNFNAYSGRARVNIFMNHNHEALKDGILLMTQDPKNPIGSFVVASSLNNQKKYKEAFKIYDGVGESKNLFTPGLLLEGEINFNLKKYQRAFILLSKYTRNNPIDEKALKYLGLIELINGNNNQALRYLENAYKINKDDINLLIYLSRAYYSVGRYDEAEKIYKNIQKEFPNHKEIANDAFELSCKMKTVQKTNPSLCRDIFKSTITEQTFDALGYMYINNPKKSFEIIEKLSKAYPDNFFVQKHYARILARQNKTDEAVTILFKILKEYPENQNILAELYTIYNSGKSSVDIMNNLLTMFEKNKSIINSGYYLANFFYTGKSYTKSMNIIKEVLNRVHDNKKSLELYEMILKIAIKNPAQYAKDIDYYIEKYRNLSPDNPLLIRLLRQSIINTSYKKKLFKNLDLPFGEKTAKDFQIYAEYLRFLNHNDAAHTIYKNAIHKFTDDFELFNSAFDFYKEPHILEQLVNTFTSYNNDYQIILQSKIFIAQKKPQQAIELLKRQFPESKNGLVAELLLKIDQSNKTINMVKNNIKNITEYSYQASFLLAEILYKQYQFSDAANLLLPYYNNKINHTDYKILLSKASFHNDFELANKIMQKLIREFPSDTHLLTESIAYEIKNKNYSQAISLFDTLKPSMNHYPHIHFYFAYALLAIGQEKQGLDILQTLIDKKYNFIENHQAFEILEKYSKNQKSGSA